MAITEVKLKGLSSNKYEAICTDPGIVCLWKVPLSKFLQDPTGIIVDPVTGGITGLTLDGTQDCPYFVKYTFETGTASFTSTRIGKGKWEQKILFTKNGLSQDVLDELKQLDQACALVTIIEDCNCNLFLFGVNYDHVDGTWCAPTENFDLDSDDTKIESGTKDGDDKQRTELSFTGQSNCPMLKFDEAVDSSIIPVA